MGHSPSGLRRVDKARVAAPVPSDIYDTEYLLSSALEGYEDYLVGAVSVLKRRELDLLDVRADQRVLDLGCGRGDVLAELVRRGCRPVGVDYSWAAASLSRALVGNAGLVIQADGVALPFPTGSFDRVLLGDVIEHLAWPLAVQALAEVRRILAPGGRALVHTSPNTWFVSYVLPPLRVALRLRGQDAVLARFDEYERLRPAMHPNELSPRTIKKLMAAAQIPARTWVDADVLRSGASEWTSSLTSWPVRLVGKLAGAWPLRLVLGNDLYAIVEQS
jgi:SAM-dependent methyltransferase